MKLYQPINTDYVELPCKPFNSLDEAIKHVEQLQTNDVYARQIFYIKVIEIDWVVQAKKEG